MIRTKSITILFLLLATASSAIAQEALIIDPSGNVGINTTTPQAQLDVRGNVIIDGHLFKRVYMATGLGPTDQTDNGQITSRILNFTKLFDTTAIKITYTDNLRVYSSSHGNSAARWEIRIDGSSIPGGQLIYDKYVSGAGGYNDAYDPVTVLGFAEGILAGTYEIQIWVGPIPGQGVHLDANTGWSNSRWTIEAEEVWIQE